MSLNTPEADAMSLQQALKDIHFFRGVLPVKAYEFLVAHHKEVTPYLIQILKNVIQRHDRTGDYYVAHVHALILLSQFREKKAYPLVIALLNLPIDSIDRLIGDMLTETISKSITSIYDGNSEPLIALLIKPEADRFVRAIVGMCFTALIYQKMIDKELFITRMQEIVASGKMNADPSFFSSLANITMNSKLEPLYDTIKAAFHAGWIFSDLMDVNLFEKSLSMPTEQLVREEDLHPVNDSLKEMGYWQGYNNPISVNIERNAKCPCGSDLKFKMCCITML